MKPTWRSLAAVLATTAAVGAHAQAGSKASAPGPKSAVDGPCKLEYQRSDNALAPEGQPWGNLGTEAVTVQPGQTRAVSTEWKYEKKRGDGTNLYGSHLRLATNRGPRPVRLTVRKNAVRTEAVTLQPGRGQSFAADLSEVACP